MSIHCSQQFPIFTEGRGLHDCSEGNQPEVPTVLLLGVAFSTLREDGSLRDALASAEGRRLLRPRPSPTRTPSDRKASRANVRFYGHKADGETARQERLEEHQKSNHPCREHEMRPYSDPTKKQKTNTPTNERVRDQEGFRATITNEKQGLGSATLLPGTLQTHLHWVATSVSLVQSLSRIQLF